MIDEVTSSPGCANKMKINNALIKKNIELNMAYVLCTQINFNRNDFFCQNVDLSNLLFWLIKMIAKRSSFPVNRHWWRLSVIKIPGFKKKFGWLNCRSNVFSHNFHLVFPPKSGDNNRRKVAVNGHLNERFARWDRLKTRNLVAKAEHIQPPQLSRCIHTTEWLCCWYKQLSH